MESPSADDYAKTLARLRSLPTGVGTGDRLCVGTACDTLFRDNCYAVGGRLARTIADRASGTYNRTAVLQAIRRLVRDVQLLANRCVMQLDAVVDERGVVSNGTRRYQRYLADLEYYLPRLLTVVGVTKDTYRDDRVAMTTLYYSLEMLQDTIDVLDPLRYVCTAGASTGPA